MKKILFDVGTPDPLRKRLAKHNVDFARERGWEKHSNGELLDLAEAHGYEVFISTDRGIQHQQNLGGRKLSVIVIRANWRLITEEIVEAIESAIEEAPAGTCVEIPSGQASGKPALRPPTETFEPPKPS